MRVVFFLCVSLIGLMSLTSCHVHTPFLSEEGKAREHIEWAVEHDPSIMDSVSTSVIVPRKQMNFSISSNLFVDSVPCWTFPEPIEYRDDSTGITVVISRNDSDSSKLDIITSVEEEEIESKKVAQVNCPPCKDFWDHSGWILFISILSFVGGCAFILGLLSIFERINKNKVYVEHEKGKD